MHKKCTTNPTMALRLLYKRRINYECHLKVMWPVIVFVYRFFHIGSGTI